MSKTINPETLIARAEDKKYPKAYFKYDIHLIDHTTEFGVITTSTVKVSKGMSSITLKTPDFDILKCTQLCKILESALEYAEKECRITL